jgi:hypothetical protein
MEINILIVLKWLFSGATLLCLGWLSEERRSLKTRVDILEGKISLLAEDLGNVKDKIDCIEVHTDTVISNRLVPIQQSLELVNMNTMAISSDILKYKKKILESRT